MLSVATQQSSLQAPSKYLTGDSVEQDGGMTVRTLVQSRTLIKKGLKGGCLGQPTRSSQNAVPVSSLEISKTLELQEKKKEKELEIRQVISGGNGTEQPWD